MLLRLISPSLTFVNVATRKFKVTSVPCILSLDRNMLDSVQGTSYIIISFNP